MEMLNESLANATKIGRVNETLDALYNETLRRGFHGLATIELLITDGTIQRITRRVERVEK